MIVRPPEPSEYQETCAVAQWLAQRQAIFCHVPNEGRRSPRRGAQQKRMGVSAGVPDLLIFSEPTHGWPGSMRQRPPRGVAIEMKRRTGGSENAAQTQWAEWLRVCGWLVCTARGARAAMDELMRLGY